MKTRFLSFLACAALGLAVTVGTTACDKQGNAKSPSPATRRSRRQRRQAQQGHERTQVVALFGQPTTPGEVEGLRDLQEAHRHLGRRQGVAVRHLQERRGRGIQQHRRCDHVHDDQRRRRPPPRRPAHEVGIAAASAVTAREPPRMEIPAELEAEDRRGHHALPRVQAQRRAAAAASRCRSTSATSARRRPTGSRPSSTSSPSTCWNW